MTLLVRPACLADRDAIVAIHCASWRDSYRGVVAEDRLGPGLETEHGAMWDRIFATPRPGSVALVATDGEVVGFLLSGPEGEAPWSEKIHALHIRPDRRSGGIGTLLMREWSDRMTAIGRRQAMLTVAEENAGARAFYARLGGQEGPLTTDPHDGLGEAPARHVTWEDLAEIGIRARGEAIRRLVPPPSLTAADQPGWSGASHPIPTATRAAARRKQPLGDPFGLCDFGIHRVEIDPGTHSTIAHYHSHEDEFVIVLEGRLTLILDGTEIQLNPGDCAGFPAGTGPSHRMENRGTELAVYLEIGARKPDRDVTRYPGEDLIVDRGPDGGRWFQRLDGTPLLRAE
ncbi:MAG: GNAT family N-acetyltransferase [Pseudomonadota bacterium]